MEQRCVCVCLPTAGQVTVGYVCYARHWSRRWRNGSWIIIYQLSGSINLETAQSLCFPPVAASKDRFAIGETEGRGIQNANRKRNAYDAKNDRIVEAINGMFQCRE